MEVPKSVETRKHPCSKQEMIACNNNITQEIKDAGRGYACMLLLYMLHAIIPCFAACADCQDLTITLKHLYYLQLVNWHVIVLFLETNNYIVYLIQQLKYA